MAKNSADASRIASAFFIMIAIRFRMRTKRGKDPPFYARIALFFRFFIRHFFYPAAAPERAFLFRPVFRQNRIIRAGFGA
ncbi:MAG: hypothetical protein IJK02_00660 [Clostridia bacterium]|nr:hypothetical protein [Clostridia bacterium]MBR0538134.1 hypothetical protein [Clostridia bacterium]